MEKQYIFVSISILALVIRHANVIIYESIVLPSVASSAVSYFFDGISKTARFSEKKVIGYKMCVNLSVQIFTETFIIVKKI